MVNSILTSIKKLLGLDEDYEVFDIDIIIHINSAFMKLNQLGVGPIDGFSISDKSSVWSDFTNIKDIEGIKTFVYLSVRLVWDPPQAGYLIEAINKQLDELAWRINLQIESGLNGREING